MITAGMQVKTIQHIENDDGTEINIGTIGRVVCAETDTYTDAPMWVVAFSIGLIGCFPNEIAPLEEIKKGEWV